MKPKPTAISSIKLTKDNFAVIILTHGKPKRVQTYKSLKSCGYTGRIILLVDDKDKTLAEYRKEFPGEVEVFSKDSMKGDFDIGDNFGGDKCVVFARNAAFVVAKKLGLEWFAQFDDDYSSFFYMMDEDWQFSHSSVKSLDAIFKLFIWYMQLTSAQMISMSQCGDYMGGEDSTRAQQFYPWRKCMNTFIMRTDCKIRFKGRLNEDVSTYVTEGVRGTLLFTIPNLAISAEHTQVAGNGMTEAYELYGTYVKSFYTIMMAPSCTTLIEIGTEHRRLHHCISWKNCTPCIVSESLRKK